MRRAQHGRAMRAAVRAAPRCVDACMAAAAPRWPAGIVAQDSRRAAPVANKGDIAWLLVCSALVIFMTLPGLGAVLRRPGAQQERAVGADAVPAGVLAGGGAVGAVRLQPGVHPGQCLHRRLGPLVRPRPHRYLDGRDLHQGRGDPGTGVLRVPGRVRLHHLRADRRCVRRTGEVRRRAAVHRAVVHLRLHADGAHGLVLPGPGCVHQQRRRARRARAIRFPVRQGRARLRRRHRGAHQCRGRRPGRCLRDAASAWVTGARRSSRTT